MDGAELAMLTGCLDATGNSLFLLASRQGLLTLVGVIGAMYPASTVVLARFVLGERLARHQLVGLGIAAGAVVLIAVGLTAPAAARRARQPWLNCCMAASTPDAAIASTASAASWQAMSSSTRSALPTLDSTQSAPRSGPPGGRPTPMRTRT